MRFLFLLIIFCIAALQTVSAQSARLQSFRSFVPPGFTILDSAYGDLNKDAYKDMILILKNNLEKSSPDTNRPVLLLAGTPGGQFSLIGRNDSIVLCLDCGGVFGDPYSRTVIKNGYFSIEHYGGSSWRWTRIITFKYDPKMAQFRLHKDAGVSFHTSAPKKQEAILNNKQDFGKLPFSKYSNEKQE